MKSPYYYLKNLREPVNTIPMELTRAFLQQLPSIDTIRREKRLVSQYVAAIRAHVLQQAREHRFSASFWIVDPVIAGIYLMSSAPLFYPWHHKYIQRFKSPYASAHLRRPIPDQLMAMILDELPALFPDCGIHVMSREIQLENVDQLFLVIEWN